MNTKVSYGSLAPAMIGGLGVVVSALLAKAKRGESPVSLRKLPEVIEFSDSGIWGENSLDPDAEPRVFRVSDFDGDFRLDYFSAPARAIAPDKLAKFQLRSGDILVVKSSGSANQVVSGRVAVFQTDSKHAFAASNFLLRLRPKTDIDPHFLAYVLGSPPTREAVADSVKTMTYPNLSFRIYSGTEVPVIPLADQRLVGTFFNALLNKQPLPELPNYLAEQRRVVARIEELAAQILEARTLREEIGGNLNAMLASAHRQIAEGAPRKPLGEVAPLSRRPVTVELEKSYPQIAVRSFGRGTFHKPPLVGSEVTWEKPFLVKTGDILVSNIKAWEGALAVAKPEDDGRVGSHRYLTCVPIRGVATPRFVCFYLLTPEGLHEVGEASPGSADRNRTLSAKGFMRVPIPVPEYSKQLWFDSLCEEVDGLKRLQAETAVELDALLPGILNKAFKGEL